MGFIEHALPEGLSWEMGEQGREGKAGKQGASLSLILWGALEWKSHLRAAPSWWQKKLDFYPPPPVRHWLRARWEGHKPPGSSGFLSCGKEAPIACVCVY